MDALAGGLNRMLKKQKC